MLTALIVVAFFTLLICVGDGIGRILDMRLENQRRKDEDDNFPSTG